MELGVDPYSVLRVIDGGDVDVRAANLVASHAALQTGVAEVLAAGATAVVLGGDHSLSMPVLRAIADRHGPDGYSVIHFDTHADTGLEMSEAPHGIPFSSAVQDGYLRGANMIQIGLRGNWPYPYEFDWMREQGFRWRTITEVIELGIAAVVREAIDFAKSRAPRTYLTIDIDVLDPAFAPGTGTAEPGGLMTRELLYAARTIASEVDLCAMDLVEVSPPYDPAGITAMAGHRVVYETLSGMALRRSGKPARPERS
jgi:agmatinase